MAKKAVYAGSFDPITNGHLDIIQRASKLFDELCVAVVVNPNKKCLFELDERMDLIKKVCSGIDNVSVSTFSGLLADFVDENDFNAVVRGLRNINDYASEKEMASINSKLYTKGTETVFFMAEQECTHISSSMVKEVASLGGNIDSFVPEMVAELIYEKYRGNE